MFRKYRTIGDYIASLHVNLRDERSGVVSEFINTYYGSKFMQLIEINVCDDLKMREYCDKTTQS